RPPPSSTLFPYTTLFRSGAAEHLPDPVLQQLQRGFRLVPDVDGTGDRGVPVHAAVGDVRGHPGGGQVDRPHMLSHADPAPSALCTTHTPATHATPSQHVPKQDRTAHRKGDAS